MSYVATASGFARRLCEAESSRSGVGMREAAALVARRVRSSGATIEALVYKPPKSVCADLFAALTAAVETQIQREIEALEHELLRLRAGRIRRSPIEISALATDLARLKSRMQGQGSLL